MYRMVYPFLSVFARALGVDVASIAAVLTARSLAGSLGPFLASIADSRGRKVGMLFGLGLFAAGVLLVVFWPAFAALAAAVVLTTLGSMISMMTEIQPAARATVMAFNVAAHSLGRATGDALAISLYALGFFWVVAVSVAFNALALLAVWQLRKDA